MPLSFLITLKKRQINCFQSFLKGALLSKVVIYSSDFMNLLNMKKEKIHKYQII